MELEYNHFKLKHKLGLFGTLREALSLCKNINFIASVCLTSLPLFCFLVFYEEILQRILLEIFEILTDPLGSHENYLISLLRVSRIIKDYACQFVYLGLLSLLPLQILKLFTAVITIDLASKVHHERSTMSLKTLTILVKNYVEKARFKRILCTSIYVLFLSVTTLFGSTWLVTIYYIIAKGFLNDMFFAALFRAACVALLGKYLEWSFVWSMSIVISVLEGVYGSEAVLVSVYCNRGFEKQGLLLMLIFSVWENGLRVLCMFGRINNGGRWVLVVAEVSLFCVGNAIKWVVFVVCFYNCKRGVLEKKVDEEAAILPL